MSDFTIDVTSTSPVEKEIKVVVPEARIQEKIREIFAEFAANAQVKGFRKGKVPRAMLERLYRKRVLKDAEVDVVQDAYRAVLERDDIKPLAMPRITREDYSGTGDYVVTFGLETRPEIDVVNLDNIVVERERMEVKDEAVDRELEKRRDQAAVMRTVSDRTVVEPGDWVVISYEGFEGDAPLKGVKIDREPLHLGEQDFIPGFKEGVIGQSVGTPFTFDVAFPEDFQAESVRGKTITFKAEIHDIQLRVLPDLDDAFARDLGDYEDLSQLRIAVRDELEKAATQRIDREFRRALWDAVIKANPIPLPPTPLMEQAKHEHEESLRQMQQYGLDPKKLGINPSDLTPRAIEAAERNLRGVFLEEKLAQDLGLSVGDEEVDAHLNEMAEQMGYPVEQIRSYYATDESRRESMVFALRHDKIVNALMDKVTVKEVEPKTPGVAPGAAQDDHACEDPDCADCHGEEKGESGSGE